MLKPRLIFSNRCRSSTMSVTWLVHLPRRLQTTHHMFKSVLAICQRSLVRRSAPQSSIGRAEPTAATAAACICPILCVAIKHSTPRHHLQAPHLSGQYGIESLCTFARYSRSIGNVAIAHDRCLSQWWTVFWKDIQPNGWTLRHRHPLRRPSNASTCSEHVQQLAQNAVRGPSAGHPSFDPAPHAQSHTADLPGHWASTVLMAIHSTSSSWDAAQHSRRISPRPTRDKGNSTAPKLKLECMGPTTTLFGCAAESNSITCSTTAAKRFLLIGKYASALLRFFRSKSDQA